MGRDKAKPAPAPAVPEPAPAAGKPPKGHRQRGAGTVITAKPAVVTGDGIVLKAHERLPSQLLHEYCQGQKKPTPTYHPNPPGNRFKVILRDGKNDKNDLTFATPQSFETSSMARDFAALLALFHVQRNLPLERRLPEPYSTTWLSMIATEKEQSKTDGKTGKGGAATPSPASAGTAKKDADSKSATTTESASAEAADEPTSKITPATLGTSSNKGSNSNLAAMVVLNRDTADWLCDSCGNQNFAKLASGAVRVRCFRCQTPKSEHCQLVASTATATTAATVASVSAPARAKVVVLKSQAAAAPVDLLTGSTATNPAARAEEERVALERRAAARRKNLYFDALRRANKPPLVHIPAGLRSRLEKLLGISSARSVADDEQLTIEDVLKQYEDSGLFAQDSCNITATQQMALLRRISAKLMQEGFAEQYVASSLREVLQQSAEDVLDDALEAVEGSSGANAGNSAQLVPVFERLLSEALLKHLCMSVDEALLPAAHNPRHLEQTKKLSVVSHGSSQSPAPASGNNSTQGAGESGAPGSDDGDSADAVVQEVAALSGAALSQCAAAVAAAKSVLAQHPQQHSEGSAAESLNKKMTLYSLMLMQEASILRDATAAPPALLTLKAALEGATSPPDFQPFLDELESLRAIFEDQLTHRFVSEGAGDDLPYHQLTLAVEVQVPSGGKAGRSGAGKTATLTLRVIVHGLLPYPQHPPLIFLTSTTSNAVSAAVLAETLQQLRSKAQELVGEGMVFQLHSCLQDCLSDALEGQQAFVSSASDFADNLRKLCAFLCRTEDLPPPSPAPHTPATAAAQTSQSVARTRGRDDDDSVATTQETQSVVSSAASGKRKANNTLQSFWTSVPTASTASSTSAKVPSDKAAAAMAATRQQLPAFSKRTEVLQLMAQHQAIVVTGETGCGKTTQVPQYLYEQNCQQKILICQPRRLAAVGVATRVAEEVGCALGEQVGYMVKGDSQISAQTRIAFCTYGVMLRRLQQDPLLAAVSVVVLDEVHERGIDSDFTLALLMLALAQRKDLKLILMSATISTDHFAAYLCKWLNVTSVPVLFIPGFTYPVREFYKADYEQIVRDFRDFTPTVRNQDFDDDFAGDTAGDPLAAAASNPYAYQIGGRPRKGDIDYDLLTKLVMVLARGALRDQEPEGDKELKGIFAPAHGSILVFMPGVPEINRLSRLLEAHYKTTPSSGAAVPKLRIIPLHGNLAPSEQKAVFRDANRGEIKIVIATNVAEASVTIPDVTVVVDTCRVKEISFDAEIQTSALMMKFAAKDSLRQRKGRAGRVQMGRCFRLITRGTYEKLPDHSIPEILRVPLEKVVLQVKAMLGSDSLSGLKPLTGKASSSMTLLCRCPDVPAESSVVAAETLLQQIQALDRETGRLTPLGRHLSTLPCMPRVGKLCIYGALLGCVYPAATVAACMTVRSPFLTSQDPEVQSKVKAAKDQFSGDAALRSDYSVLVNVLAAYDNCRNKRRFCQDYGLAFERMNEIKDTQADLLSGLVDLGMLVTVKDGQDPHSQANCNAGRSRLVTATLCAGLYPQLAKILRPSKRFVEVSGGTVERDALAKELKFYIPKNLASVPTADGAGGANTETATISAPAAAKAIDKRNVDISTDELYRVFVHPSSCNFDNNRFKESNFVMYGERQLVVYPSNGTSGTGSGSAQDSKVFLRDTTEAPAFALLFFGGQLQANYADGTVTVDDWIRFTAPGRTVAILQELRSAFDALLLRKFQEPSLALGEQAVVGLTCDLLDLTAQLY